MAIPKGTKANFQTLLQAAKDSCLCALECRRRSDGAIVAMVCAVNKEENGAVSFAPLAEMITGNPYEMYDPPMPDGGFEEKGAQPKAKK